MACPLWFAWASHHSSAGSGVAARLTTTWLLPGHQTQTVSRSPPMTRQVTMASPALPLRTHHTCARCAAVPVPGSTHTVTVAQTWPMLSTHTATLSNLLATVMCMLVVNSGRSIPRWDFPKIGRCFCFSSRVLCVRSINLHCMATLQTARTRPANNAMQQRFEYLRDIYGMKN